MTWLVDARLDKRMLGELVSATLFLFSAAQSTEAFAWRDVEALGLIYLISTLLARHHDTTLSIFLSLDYDRRLRSESPGGSS